MTGYFTTERHEQLRQTVRVFAQEEVRPRIPVMELTQDVEADLARLIAEQGWMGVTIGREYGGMGAGHVAKLVINQELSRVYPAMGAAAQASQLGVAKIIHFGTPEQKATWLPAIARGECLPTIAVTERGSGSHVLGMATTAHREGKYYVLNGSKAFVGNSHIAHLHGVVARTAQTPGRRSLSAFLVEADRPGLSLVPYRPAVGLPGFSFGEIVFDNCRIPVANLLGEEGDGMDVAYSSSILYGRSNLTAVALGIHEAIAEQTAQFAAGQMRPNGPLSELPTVRDQLARIQSQLMTARLAAYHAAHLLDEAQPCDAELQNAKLVNAEHALDSARLAMEIHGGYALFPHESSIARFQRDAWHIAPPAGTSAVQRLRLAEVALGEDNGSVQWSVRFADPTVAGAAWRLSHTARRPVSRAARRSR